MKQLLLLLAFAYSIVAEAQENIPADKRLNGLDTAFARVLSVWKGAGFAVAVVEKNKVVYEKGFGLRNVEKKLPVTPNTLFAIGSCTKAFTASQIGVLAAKGDLDIDKPVRDYLPELKFYNNEMNNAVTIRDIMCHRTGLPRHDYSWYFFSSTSRDSLLSRIEYLEPSAHLREKWQYNNFMYMVQGVIIEKFAHQSWETIIKNNIFQPLGMIHSNLSIPDLEKDSNAAIGYKVKDSAKIQLIKKTDYYPIDAMGPAGAINSSVTDMANWVITWIHAGKFKGKEIFPAGFAHEAMSAQMVSGKGLPDEDNKDLLFSTYGFGWTMVSYEGHYRVEHGGNINGFTASTCFFPSDSIGIIVLANQENSSIPSIVRNLVVDRMLGLKHKDWNNYLWQAIQKLKQEGKDAEASKMETAVVRTNASHPLKNYAGLYNNKGYGNMNVYLEHDSMFLQIGKNISWLKQDKYDWFKIYSRDKQGLVDTISQGFPIEFRTSANGEINEVDAAFEPSVKTIVFSRIANIVNVQADSLKKFEGEYTIGAITLKVFLQSNNLHLIVPGQPEYELLPVDVNKFTLKGLSGFTIIFDTNAKNEVTSMTSVQPNGSFKAAKK